MRISKYDLCYSCREIRMTPDITIEDFLESKGYTHPVGYILMNRSVATFLEDDGCQSCASLARRAAT